MAQEEPQEMVQEDTESVSEDGSLESQDWRGEQQKSVDPVVTSDEETFKALEQKGELAEPQKKTALEDFGTPLTEEEKIEESERYSASQEEKGKDAVSIFLENNKLSSLDALPNQISESVRELSPGAFTSSIEQALYSTRNEEITDLSKSYLENRKKSIQSEEVSAGKTEEEAKLSLIHI